MTLGGIILNKELKLKKIDELIKELSDYKNALEKDETYFFSEKLDTLIYNNDKNMSELFNFKNNKIKIEYGEFHKEKVETLLMTRSNKLFARCTIDGYTLTDDDGNVIIKSDYNLLEFLHEVESKYIIDDKYILELCKLNENREIIINFMKEFNYTSMHEYPGDLRFDFDYTYISFKYDNEEIEVIDPSLSLFDKFKEVSPQAVLSSISPLCF